MNFWKNIVWSDESKFNLFDSDGKVIVWITLCEEFDPKCTIPTIKHGMDSVMVWGCFASQRVGKLCVLDCTMDRFYYRDILGQILRSSINRFKLGQRYIFMHDYDRQHTSRLIEDLLKTLSPGHHIHQILIS